jgi:hypothetical protein
VGSSSLSCAWRRRSRGSRRTSDASRPAADSAAPRVDVVLSGTQLKDAQELFLYKPGLESPQARSRRRQDRQGPLQDRRRRAARRAHDAPPHRDRHQRPEDVLRRPFPIVEEKEPNNNFKQPRRSHSARRSPASITNEDVDYFSVELKKGERLSVELEGIRLGQSLFDAYVGIFDTKRFEIVSADDTALLLQDPYLTMLAPEDGTYIIQVRETSYGGGDNGAYRLHVGSFPVPSRSTRAAARRARSSRSRSSATPRAR